MEHMWTSATKPRMGQSQTASENLPKTPAKHCKSDVKVSNLKSSLWEHDKSSITKVHTQGKTPLSEGF